MGIVKPVVRAERLGRRFGAIEAVREVSFELFPGEVLGLLGPNGAGKTTLVRMLAGVLAPTSGDAWVAGRSVVREPEAVKQVIGYAPQQIGVYPLLSVRQNLEFRASLYLSRREVARAVTRALERFGLAELAMRSAGELSGGWRQRLSLAQALVHLPAVAYLDEPTSGLDPISRQQVWDLVYGEARRGAGILITTHYMEEAERCHRVGLLFKGSLMALGHPQELKDRVAARYRFAEGRAESPPPQALDGWRIGERLRIVSPKGAPLPAGFVPVEPGLGDVFMVFAREAERAA